MAEPVLIHSQTLACWSGDWVSIAYSQSFLSPPRRPLLRFHGPDGTVPGGAVIERIMPAAVFGRACWLGPVPDASAKSGSVTLEILVWDSPAEHFRIDSVARLGVWQLRGRLLRQRPLSLLAYGLLRLVHGASSADTLARVALSCEPLHRLAAFAARHHRRPEPDGLDRLPPLPQPACDPPLFEFLMVVTTAGDWALAAETLASLERQVAPVWRLSLAMLPEAEAQGRCSWTPLGPRAPDPVPFADQTSALAGLTRQAKGKMVAVLTPGDRLVPEATLALIPLALRPEVAALYTDSATIDRHGRLLTPQLKPDWSPELARHRAYIGGLSLYRPAGPAPAAVHHLPRLLLHTLQGHTLHGHALHGPQPLAALPGGRGPNQAASPTTGQTAGQPRVSIIIPTRDHLPLLRRAIRTVERRTDYLNYEIVVVDNNSAEPATLAYLTERQRAGALRVIRDDGPFNFPRLVNRAVAETASPVIVLLNNDTFVLTPGWLGALVRLALAPGVGAVGAKLLYPNGRLQHAGVVVGLGGGSGHYFAGKPGNHRDHLGRLQVAHEVLAVTGACLAVQRRHWQRVGGWDEQFKVDFNDADFCLRLADCGLRTLWTPEAVLGHQESASRRGPTGQRSAAFRAEAQLFANRWRHHLLNDPYFHPALSLTRFSELLE